MSDMNFDPLAQALRNLPPVPHALSRERLLFEAGRSAARNPMAWVWQSMTAILAVTTIALACFLVTPPRQGSADVALTPRTGNGPNTPPPAPQVKPVIPEDSMTISVPELTPEMISSIRLRHEILEGGIDQLPDEQPPYGLANSAGGKSIFELTDGLSGGVFAVPVPRDFKK